MSVGLMDVVIGGRRVRMHSLTEVAAGMGVALDALPYVGRTILASLLADGDHAGIIATVRALNGTDTGCAPEVSLRPTRVLLQDYTGVPLLADLAAARDYASNHGLDPALVDSVVPVDLVVDHSVQADVAGSATALRRNERLEFARNRERYAFLRWAERAFSNLRIVPPGDGIVHQLNAERLAAVVTLSPSCAGPVARPEVLVGTDSHTPMIGGLGVVSWGMGGLDAEAVMLGAAPPIALPKVVGVTLSGQLSGGVTAIDLALTLAQVLRGRELGRAIIEFTGNGADGLSAAERCTVCNMAPEYGAMTAFFPVDAETLRYLELTGRDAAQVALVSEYCAKQRLLRERGDPFPDYSCRIHVDLEDIEPSAAGPSQPHHLVRLTTGVRAGGAVTERRPTRGDGEVRDGDVVIAALTSCMATADPQAMLGAGLVAQRAEELGLSVPRHVKTSFGPGSQSSVRLLESAGLMKPLEAVGFHVVGYGCTTCNGGSGALAPEIEAGIKRDGTRTCAVISGNRNYPGRVHPLVRDCFLMSPAHVVAIAVRGHVRGNLAEEPLGQSHDGRPVLLSDLLPDDETVAELVARHLRPRLFAGDLRGGRRWDTVDVRDGVRFPWNEASTYIRRPPFCEPGGRSSGRGTQTTLRRVRVLAALDDFVSTDEISPVGQIAVGSVAGEYLRRLGVGERDLNSYGARRANHEVMARGTLSSPRLRNALLDGAEGGKTLHLPTGERLRIFEAAALYRQAGIPLVILAGRAYGSGSSRDWAAKGPKLLGVHAVLAESFEPIHRANLCAVGILPLLFPEGRGWRSLGLTGHEEFTLVAATGVRASREVLIHARQFKRRVVSFTATADVRVSQEWEIIAAGGMLRRVLTSLERR